MIVSHPDVADCLVIGLPDERFGQKVVALVSSKQRTPGLADSTGRIRAGQDGGLQATAALGRGRRDSANAQRQGRLQGGALARRARVADILTRAAARTRAAAHVKREVSVEELRIATGAIERSIPGIHRIRNSPDRPLANCDAEWVRAKGAGVDAGDVPPRRWGGISPPGPYDSFIVKPNRSEKWPSTPSSSMAPVVTPAC